MTKAADVSVHPPLDLEPELLVDVGRHFRHHHVWLGVVLLQILFVKLVGLRDAGGTDNGNIPPRAPSTRQATL